MKGKSTDTKGIVLVFIAALLWSTNSILIKNINLPPMLISGTRAIIAGLVLAPFIRPKKIKWNIKLLFLMLAYATNSTCIVLAVKMTSAPIAIGMQFTAPIWLYLYSRLKGYPFYARRAVPLGVLTLGVIISMFSKADGVTMLGNIIALSTGVWFALITALSKACGSEDPIGIASLNNLFMAAIILPIFCTGTISQLLEMDTAGWLTVLALGIFQFGGGYVFYNIGLKYTTAARASMISPLEMVFSPIWVALFMGEIPDIIGIIGFLVITLGVGLEVLFTQKYEKAAKLQSGE